jgi:hypothetical protein
VTLRSDATPVAEPNDRSPTSEPAAPADARPGRGISRGHVVLGLGALFLLVTIVMVFPSITQLRTATPGDHGDPVFSQWLLRWEIHSLATRPRGVFNANIYWPKGNTLVYSDTELAVVPIAAVVGAVFRWPLAYNVMYLAGWVASLACTYLLARWLRASRPAAVLASFVFTFAAVRVGHYGHFPMLGAFVVPLSLLLLLRFLTERRWWQAVALGVCCAAVFLDTGYLAVVLAPALAVVALGWVIATRFHPGPRFWPGLAVTGAVFALLSWPLVLKYRAEPDLRRTYVVQTAATFHDFLQPAEHSLLYSPIEKRLNPLFENRLFPGYLALALGIVGIVAWSRERERQSPSAGAADERLRRRGRLLVVLGGVPALALAFGKYQTFGSTRVTFPYSWVAGFPGFQSVRAFGRFTVIPVLSLGILVAVAYDWLVTRRTRRAVARVGIAALLGVAMLAEYKSRIITARNVVAKPASTVNDALARLPKGPVLELPMGDPKVFTWAFVEAPRMLLSSIDWKPRVNGYSGYAPPNYQQTVDTLNTLDDGGAASPDALALLDTLGVRYVVVRTVPPDGDPKALGVSFEDPGTAAGVLSSLPNDRIAGATWEPGGLVIRLRPAGGTTAPAPSAP